MNAPEKFIPADPRHDPSRVIRAPRGTTLNCKNWLIEAAYRMIQNNLDAEVAEDPTRLVVYGGIGRAARVDCQLQPGAEMGELGTLQRTRPQRLVHVRPDDRRQLDLHRQPRHCARHV